MDSVNQKRWEINYTRHSISHAFGDHSVYVLLRDNIVKVINDCVGQEMQSTLGDVSFVRESTLIARVANVKMQSPMSAIMPALTDKFDEI